MLSRLIGPHRFLNGIGVRLDYRGARGSRAEIAGTLAREPRTPRIGGHHGEGTIGRPAIDERS